MAVRNEEGWSEQRGEAGAEGARRSITYCLIPYELAAKLHEPLRAHFADDPSVEVVVEQRDRSRRSAPERRRGPARRPAAGERRRIRNPGGRRVGERRAELLPLVGKRPALPRRARRHAERINFAERVEPASELLEDLDTARLVIRFQAGEEGVFDLLYRRYFDRVYGYLRLLLRDTHEAEDLAQEVFMKLVKALPGYERRRQPFRAWLFVVARNAAVSFLRKNGRVEVEDPALLNRLYAETENGSAGLDTLGWISDTDLLLFVERLPRPQRQVLLLRYMLDLSVEDTARVLGIEANHVRVLQHRAIRFLNKRLSAIGRAPKAGRRARSRRCAPQARVLRARRWALMG